MLKLNKLVNKKLLNLKKKSHGGEIYKFSIDKGKFIDFSTNINHLFALKDYNDIINEALNQITKYPDSDSSRLKKSLNSYFQSKLKPENFIVSSGSMELIDLFGITFVQKNNKVIIYQPTFSEYEWVVKKCGGRILNVFRDEDNNFQLDFNILKKNLSKNPKCVYICSPNNPNGYLDDRKLLEEFIFQAGEQNVLVFLDEAFIEFTGEKNSMITRIDKYPNLFVTRSFTKFFGIPGLRIGFGVSNVKIIELLKKVQVPWPVNNIAQKLAEKLIQSKEFIKTSKEFFEKERDYVISELSNIKGFKIFPSSTNFLLINTKDTEFSSKILRKKMLKHNILIRDCSNYEGLDEYYIRIAIKSREQNNRLIDALSSICNQF
ncbi:MAG: pyridoxal phosphate-dependent aminotransferase [Promethearchaeota archaeon]